jgi:hypothetical protein
MRFPLLIVLALAACTPYVPPVPQHVMGKALGPMETAELMHQAVDHSRYPMPDRLPIIDVIPEEEWEALFCKGTSDDCNLLGMYVDGPDEVNVVHVRDVPAISGRTYRSIAIHELTHWLQVHSGAGFANDCKEVAANEMEAYEVEYLNDLDQGLVRSFQMGDVLGECLKEKRGL